MDHVEAVLTVVEQIPAGRVMTYGALADVVGTVLAHYGGGVPWHRVVTAGGRVPPGNEDEALRRLRAEGTPLRGDRVDVATALWFPPQPPVSP